MKREAGLRARLTADAGHLRLDVELDTASANLVLIGPNGAGKTTLLELLLGISPCRRGRISVGDTVLLDTALGVDLPVERRGLGYVPQDYALFPHLSVRDNVAFALESSPLRATLPETQVDAVLRDLALVEIQDRRPAGLSGGEKQRVALARALSVRPRALLLDEPLAALDVPARREVRAFLVQTLDTLAVPSVVTTHDPADARALGGRIAVLEAGRITQTGTWAELERAPATPFVAEFVAAGSA